MKWKAFLTGSEPGTIPNWPEVVGIVFLLLVLVFVAGCTSKPIPAPDFTPSPIDVIVTVPYFCGVPPAVDPVNMRSINWDIMTVDDVDLYTLTVSDYSLLGLNVSDWLTASWQMKLQRDFYRDCITRSQADTQTPPQPQPEDSDEQ